MRKVLVTGTQASEVTISKQAGWIQPLPYLTNLSQKWFQQKTRAAVPEISEPWRAPPS